MSQSDDETTERTEGTEGIDDEQLPEDLQPHDDNPLAQPNDDDVDPEGLDLEIGAAPDPWDDEQVED